MSRLRPADRSAYEPLFGEGATLRQQVLVNAGDLARRQAEWVGGLREGMKLSPRLVELVRLRIAFHNQCRTCMSVRYSSATEEGVDEGLVCSLEKPQEAADLTAAEKAAVDLADRFATDHLSIDDDYVAAFLTHFGESELMELLLHLATFVGFGRMMAVLDITEELPAEYGDPAATLAPWHQRPAMYI